MAPGASRRCPRSPGPAPAGAAAAGGNPRAGRRRSAVDVRGRRRGRWTAARPHRLSDGPSAAAVPEAHRAPPPEGAGRGAPERTGRQHGPAWQEPVPARHAPGITVHAQQPRPATLLTGSARPNPSPAPPAHTGARTARPGRRGTRSRKSGGPVPRPAPGCSHHRVAAQYTDTTVTVHQAYAPAIGRPAARDGRFPPSWTRDRMTWVKPSFLWMTDRCGWATRRIRRRCSPSASAGGFAGALRHARLTHHDPAAHPHRDAWRRRLRRPLPPARARPRGGTPVRRRVDRGRHRRHPAGRIHALVRRGDLDATRRPLPRERPHPLDDAPLAHLRAPAPAH